jgi:hypothetical protein
MDVATCSRLLAGSTDYTGGATASSVAGAFAGVSFGTAASEGSIKACRINTYASRCPPLGISTSGRSRGPGSASDMVAVSETAESRQSAASG